MHSSKFEIRMLRNPDMFQLVYNGKPLHEPLIPASELDDLVYMIMLAKEHFESKVA